MASALKRRRSEPGMTILGRKGETRHLTRTELQQGVRHCLLLGTIPSLKSLPFPNFPGMYKLSSSITSYSTQTAFVYPRRSLSLGEVEIAHGSCWNHSLHWEPWQTRTGPPFYIAKRFERFEAEEATSVYGISHCRRSMPWGQHAC